MNENNSSVILKQVQLLFKQTMGNDVEVDINTEKDMVAEWDSVNHLNLIVELENEYDLGLTMEEIEKLSTVSQIVELIKARRT